MTCKLCFHFKREKKGHKLVNKFANKSQHLFKQVRRKRTIIIVHFDRIIHHFHFLVMMHQNITCIINMIFYLLTLFDFFLLHKLGMLRQLSRYKWWSLYFGFCFTYIKDGNITPDKINSIPFTKLRYSYLREILFSVLK